MSWMNPSNINPSQQPNLNNPRKKAPTKLIALITGIIALLAIGAVIVYFAVRTTPSANEKDDSQATNQQSETDETETQEETTPPASGSAFTQQDSNEVKRLTNEYVEAVRAKNQPAAVALTCEQIDPGLMYAAVTTGQDYTITVVGDPTSNRGNRATSVTKVTTAGEEIEFKILFEKNSNGSWCIYL